MKSYPILFIRSLVFYIVYIATLIPFTTLCIIFGLFLPLKTRFKYFVLWNTFIISWLRIACGTHYIISGKDNIPSGSYVLLSNHQSPWETIFLYSYFQPLTATLKKSLLYIPFFGWALAMLKPIAIDRSKKRLARKMLLQQGQDRLQEGISILIFPEGTRVNPGDDKAWSTGGATLAIEAQTTILPVAHNAGVYWPAHQFIKYPGVVKVVIGDPINATGLSPRELTEEIRQWTKQVIQ